MYVCACLASIRKNLKSRPTVKVWMYTHIKSPLYNILFTPFLTDDVDLIITKSDPDRHVLHHTKQFNSRVIPYSQIIDTE